MRKIVYILTVVFILTSCSSILFTEAQPADAPLLQEFPGRILGEFTNSEDTLVVNKTSFVYDGGDVITLSGDLTPPGVVLKKMDNWYFLSIQDDTEWWIYPFQISGKDRITVYYSDMADKEQNIIQEFQKDLKVQKIYKEGKLDHYLISPTKAQFKKMLKKGLFSEKMIFTRIK